MANDLAAVQAYQAAVRAAQQGVKGDEAEKLGMPDFGNMVTSALTDTGNALQAAETVTAQAAAGEADLVDVVTAVSAAELSLETVIAVRDEVIRAYQEILRMPI